MCFINWKIFLPVQRRFQIATKSSLLAAFFISALSAFVLHNQNEDRQ